MQTSSFLVLLKFSLVLLNLALLIAWFGIVRHPMVFIFLNLFDLLEFLVMLMTLILVNKVLTAKLLRQGYRYHKLRKAFSKFYRRHFDIVSKYNVGLKTLSSARPFRT